LKEIKKKQTNSLVFSIFFVVKKREKQNVSRETLNLKFGLNVPRETFKDLFINNLQKIR